MTPIILTTQAVAKIEELLAEKGWSRAELARRSGIQQPHITNLMNAHKATSLATLVKLANAFEVHPRELLAELKKGKPKK